MADEPFWDPAGGIGIPASLSDSAAPFHPLTLLSNALPHAWRLTFITAASAIIAALLCFMYLRRLSADMRLRAVSALLVAGVIIAQPRLALLALGAISLLLVIDWFGVNPTRVRWAVVVITAVVALLGTRSSGLTALAILVICAAFTASADQRTSGAVAAGALSAAAVAALLAMPWVLTLFAVYTEELPAAAQHAVDWPLTVTAALPLFVAIRRKEPGTAAMRLTTAVAATLLVAGVIFGSGGTTVLSAVALTALISRRRIRESAAVAALALTAVTLLAIFIAPPPDCAVRSERRDGKWVRILDTAAPSLDCVSSRVASLLERARIDERWDLESVALDVAGIDEIESDVRAGNFRVLPDIYLALQYHVTAGGPAEAQPLSWNRTSVDHFPVKIARLGAPAGGAPGAGGELKVERRRPGHLRIRIRSDGWNLLVTTEPAWSGWRAYWNSERLPPVVVNQAFVGSFVPPGDGVLTVRYRPAEVDAGLRFAAAGLLLLVITLVIPWYRRVPAIRGIALPAIPILARVRVPAPRWLSWRPASRQVAAFAVLLLMGYLVLLSVNFATIAGGADSSGYMNHARLWERGEFIVPLTLPQQLGVSSDLDPAFIPLGFVHGPEPYTMVPSYPPGLPLLITAGRAIGGEFAAFRVVALVTTLGVFLMYLLGRAYELPRGWAAAGAAILALFPTYVFLGVQPASDSVAAALAIAAMLGAVRSRESALWAVLAGAAIGGGVMVRPTQVLLFPAVVLALRLRPRALFAFGLGGLPFAIAQAAISNHLYGSPFATGYGGIGYLIVPWEGFVIRFKHYSYWLAVLATPLIFPGGMAVWFSRVADRWTRAGLAAWFLPFFIFYCYYAPYETWWYTRFLLPALPPLIIGALLVLREVISELLPRRRALPALLIAGILAVEVVHCDRFNLLDYQRHETIYTESVFGAERHLPDDAMLLTMQLSGAVRYYTNRPIVRWDGIDPAKYAQLRKASASRPWYALLSEFEIEDAKRNAPGEWIEIERYRNVVLFRLR